MILPCEWHEVASMAATHAVMPARRVQPSNVFVREFRYRDDHLLAVKGVAPYGVLSDVSDWLDFGLLRAVARRPAFSMYLVPDELLSLSACTFGTRREGAEPLEDAYRRIGDRLRRLDRAVGVPIVAFENLAIDRSDGRAVVLPPARFGNSDAELSTLANSLVETMRTTFRFSHTADAIGRLADALMDGALHC